MQQGLGAARRAGHAISKRVKATLGSIDLGGGVGDDESSFGQGGNRAWYELALEEARRRLLVLFEKSGFDRYFPRFEKFVRRVLGNPPQAKKIAPGVPLPPSERRTLAKVKARTPDEIEAERLRAEVRRSMMMAHQREAAGLRERIEKHRQSHDGDESE